MKHCIHKIIFLRRVGSSLINDTLAYGLHYVDIVEELIRGTAHQIISDLGTRAALSA